MLLNNEWIKNEIKEELKKFGNNWKWTHNGPQPMRHRENSLEREVHSDTDLAEKHRNISNKQPNATSTTTGGTTTKARDNKRI